MQRDDTDGWWSEGFPLKRAAHRDKSREKGRLKEKVEPLLTLGNSGYRTLVADEGGAEGRHPDVPIRVRPPCQAFPLQTVWSQCEKDVLKELRINKGYFPQSSEMIMVAAMLTVYNPVYDDRSLGIQPRAG